jgi:Flp pilus assembly protein TadD
MADAKALLDQAKDKGAKGEAFDKLAQHLNSVEPTASIVSKHQDPPQDQLQPIINLYSQGQLQQALNEASQLLQQFPSSVILYNINGAANQGLGRRFFS